MKNKSFKETIKDPQMIIAICVVGLSLCALFVSLFQAKIMNEQRDLMLKQAKASVWPRIELGISKSHSQDNSITKYKFGISNNGVGPAIIIGVRVSFNDITVNQWAGIFNQLTIDPSNSLMSSNSGFNNIVLQAGSYSTILDLTQNLPLAQAFYNDSGKIKIEIYYESIYADIWKLTIPKLGSGEKHLLEEVEDMSLTDHEQFLY